MLDSAIIQFLEERTAKFIKGKINSTTTEQQLLEIEAAAEEKFSLVNYIPDAAKRAGQLSFTTHAVTLSHPSARKNKNGYASATIADCQQANDGYLRSGNVAVELDALGNAAALDVYKLLTLIMADGNRLLEHIKQETQLAHDLLEQAGDYQQLRQQFLTIIAEDTTQITSEKIKQVYVTTEDSYHLLSVLNPSSIIFAMKNNIDNRRFSETAKQAREAKKKNESNKDGFEEFFDLTTIGFGGSKPQNISVLNNTNGGKAYLLPSLPPVLVNYKIRIPKKDFFSETMQVNFFTNIFKDLHKLYKNDRNNFKMRRKIQSCYLDIFYQIIASAKKVRQQLTNNTSQNITNISEAQQIWLGVDQISIDKRNDKNAKNWLDNILTSIAKFIINGYKKIIKDTYQLADTELLAVKSLLEVYQEKLNDN